MKAHESKVECVFRFYVDGEQHARSAPVSGVLHLFEHDYDEATKFWYGVADIACMYEEFHSAIRDCDPTKICIGVTLPDGRMGGARHLASQTIGVHAPHVRVTLFGFTLLAPDE